MKLLMIKTKIMNPYLKTINKNKQQKIKIKIKKKGFNSFVIFNIYFFKKNILNLINFIIMKAIFIYRLI